MRPSRYTLVAIILHWVMALGIALDVGVDFDIVAMR
jgi:cytochrome b561